MTIQYIKKQNYGNEALYIANKETAQTITNLTGTKTLTRSQIGNLSKLGIKCEQILN